MKKKTGNCDLMTFYVLFYNVEQVDYKASFFTEQVDLTLSKIVKCYFFQINFAKKSSLSELNMFY